MQLEAVDSDPHLEPTRCFLHLWDRQDAHVVDGNINFRLCCPEPLRNAIIDCKDPGLMSSSYTSISSRPSSRFVSCTEKVESTYRHLHCISCQQLVQASWVDQVLKYACTTQELGSQMPFHSNTLLCIILAIKVMACAYVGRTSFNEAWTSTDYKYAPRHKPQSFDVLHALLH